MNGGNARKRTPDRRVEVDSVGSFCVDFDQGAEPGLGAVHTHVHFSATAWIERTRRTQSAMCLQESVAPLMFWMSSSSLSGAPWRTPLNCARHFGLRISPPWVSR